MRNPQNKNLEQNNSIDWKTGETSIRFDKQPGGSINFDSSSLLPGGKTIAVPIFKDGSSGSSGSGSMEPYEGTPFEIVRQASFTVRIPRKPETRPGQKASELGTVYVKDDPDAEAKAMVSKARPKPKKPE